MSTSILIFIDHVKIVHALVTLDITFVVVLIRIALIRDILQKLLLFLPFGESEWKFLPLSRIVQLFLVWHLTYDLERVSLIDQKLLSFVRVIHLLSIS